MERARVLRFVRIAVTAISLTACVLLTALWVRSYWYWDNVVWGMTTKQGFTARSQHGQFVLKYIDVRSLPAELNAALFKWHRETHLAGEADRLPASTLGFSLKLGIGMPYCCPVLVTGALVAASWSRRDWHFSLRTLLIATTLVAVGMGVIVATS